MDKPDPDLIVDNPDNLKKRKGKQRAKPTKPIKQRKVNGLLLPVQKPLPPPKRSAQKPDAAGIPRAHQRAGNGVRALYEIRHYQKSGEPLLKAVPFTRIVKEIVQDNMTPGRDPFQMMKSALNVLRVVAEDVIVTRFELLQASAIHCGCVTVTPKDSQHLGCLRGILGTESLVHVVPEDITPEAGYKKLTDPLPTAVPKAPKNPKNPKNRKNRKNPKGPRKSRSNPSKSTKTSAQPIRPAPPSGSQSRRRVVR